MMDSPNANFLNNIAQLMNLMSLDDQASGGSQEPAPTRRRLRPQQSSCPEPKADDQQKNCGFCKRNGEASSVYQSHNLKENGKVACPILRNHVCELCGATGDVAHTRSYCLMAAAGRSMSGNDPNGHIYHNSVVLKKTGRNSCGRKQF